MEPQVFIAKDRRSGMHCIVRPATKELLSRQFSTPDPEDFNHLLMARDAESLLEAAVKLGPLRNSNSGDSSLVNKLLDPASVFPPSVRSSFLGSPNAERLLSECFFDPYSTAGEGREFNDVGRPPKAATKRAIERFSMANDRAQRIVQNTEWILIEPIHDWIFMRNSLSVLMRLAGIRRTRMESANILREAGFEEVLPSSARMKKTLGNRAFIIPIAYNPFYREGSLILNELNFDESVIWPLFDSLTEPRESLVHGRVDHHMATDRSIRFLTSVQVGQSEGSFAPRRSHPEESRWWYLAICDDGKSTQLDLANRLLRSFDSSLFKPEVSYSADAMHEISHGTNPETLFQALWLLAREHPERYVLTCDQCHRTILSGTQGGERRFCSNSCRATWNKSH